jgi:hypothetical protein
MQRGLRRLRDGRAARLRLQLDLLGNYECVVHLNPEIADRALQLFADGASAK